MPKVHVKQARKDYPEDGIQKGDTYYSWTFYRQKPKRSKKPPTRSQLTQHEGLLAVFAIYDGDLPTDPVGIEGMADQLEEAAEIFDEKRDAMPESLQSGDQACAYEQASSNCSMAADELRELAGELAEEEPEEPLTEEEIKAMVAKTEPDMELW